MNSDEEFQRSSWVIIGEAITNAGKAIILLNGAAAIAVLTKITVINELGGALLTYSWGAGMGALVFMAAYFSQYYFMRKENKLGIVFQIMGIVMFLVGFFCFIIGGYLTYKNLIPTNLCGLSKLSS